MSRKRKYNETFTEKEVTNIKQINQPKFEDNLKSCLVRLKADKNITRFCKKILYLTGMSPALFVLLKWNMRA